MTVHRSTRFALWRHTALHTNVIDGAVFAQIIHHNVWSSWSDRTPPTSNTKIVSSDLGNSQDLAGFGLGGHVPPVPPPRCYANDYDVMC